MTKIAIADYLFGRQNLLNLAEDIGYFLVRTRWTTEKDYRVFVHDNLTPTLFPDTHHTPVYIYIHPSSLKWVLSMRTVQCSVETGNVQCGRHSDRNSASEHAQCTLNVQLVLVGENASVGVVCAVWVWV